MQDNLHIYYAFGNDKAIMIEGRILKERDFSVVSNADNIFKNIWRKFKQLLNDEIKNRDVIINIGGDTYTSKSDHEGYFLFEILLKKPLSQGYHDRARVGIISDFDDTVIISEVTQKVKLAYNLLAKNYKQRELVSGMRERFEKILQENPPHYPLPLFFLTGSPKQLFGSIENFLDFHHFPTRQLIINQVHGEANDPLFD